VVHVHARHRRGRSSSTSTAQPERASGQAGATVVAYPSSLGGLNYSPSRLIPDRLCDQQRGRRRRSRSRRARRDRVNQGEGARRWSTTGSRTARSGRPHRLAQLRQRQRRRHSHRHDRLEVHHRRARAWRRTTTASGSASSVTATATAAFDYQDRQRPLERSRRLPDRGGADDLPVGGTEYLRIAIGGTATSSYAHRLDSSTSSRFKATRTQSGRRHCALRAWRPGCSTPRGVPLDRAGLPHARAHPPSPAPHPNGDPEHRRHQDRAP